MTQCRVSPEDIILRPLMLDDVTDRYVVWLNDPDVNAYLEVRHKIPVSREDVVRFCRECDESRRPLWGIFVRGLHVGNVSSSAYDARSGWADISFLVGDKAFWGRGVASCALASAAEYFFSVTGFHKVRGGVYDINAASKRVFEKLGFTPEARLREEVVVNGRRVDVLKYGLMHQEWEKVRASWATCRVEPLAWALKQ